MAPRGTNPTWQWGLGLPSQALLRHDLYVRSGWWRTWRRRRAYLRIVAEPLIQVGTVLDRLEISALSVGKTLGAVWLPTGGAVIPRSTCWTGFPDGKFMRAFIAAIPQPLRGSAKKTREHYAGPAYGAPCARVTGSPGRSPSLERDELLHRRREREELLHPAVGSWLRTLEAGTVAGVRGEFASGLRWDASVGYGRSNIGAAPFRWTPERLGSHPRVHG